MGWWLRAEGRGLEGSHLSKGFQEAGHIPGPHVRGGEGPGVFASEKIGDLPEEWEALFRAGVGEGPRAGGESVNARPPGSVVRRQVSSHIGFHGLG